MYTKITKALSPKTAILHAFFLFNFAMPSLEGKAVWNDAINHDFVVPEGKYYLAGAGYPTCNQLLVPYQGVCYHLAEWGRANVWYVIFFLTKLIKYSPHSPANKEEVFNLCHTSACKVFECIFGVLKCRFHILILQPAYSTEVQARIPAELCVIHNLIQKLDSSEGNLPAETVSFGYGGSDEEI